VSKTVDTCREGRRISNTFSSIRSLRRPNFPAFSQVPSSRLKVHFGDSNAVEGREAKRGRHELQPSTCNQKDVGTRFVLARHPKQRRKRNERRSLTVLVTILALGTVGLAQHVVSEVEKAAKTTGRVTEKAAKKIAHGTVKAAKETAQRGEKAASETGRGTEKAAKETEKVSKLAADGTEKAADETARAAEKTAKKTEHEVKSGAEDLGHGVKKVATKTVDAVK